MKRAHRRNEKEESNTAAKDEKDNTAHDPCRLAEVLLVVIVGSYTRNGDGSARMYAMFSLFPHILHKKRGSNCTVISPYSP